MNFRVKIGATNGYQTQEVMVNDVVNQAAARRVVEATHPGAAIRSVIPSQR